MGEAAQTAIYRDLLVAHAGRGHHPHVRHEGRVAAQQRPRRVRPGMRALQVDPEFQKQFETQIRALLRAAATAGHLRILLPFVTGVEDVRAARAIVTRVTQQLKAERRRGADACRSGRWSKCPPPR